MKALSFPQPLAYQGEFGHPSNLNGFRTSQPHSEIYFLRNQIAKAFGVKAGFGVPILVNQQVLAVLVFFMSEARLEDRQLVELVQAAATQLGALLECSLS